VVDVPPGHARNVVFDPKGYWFAPSGEALSFPADGNTVSFSIEDDSIWFRHRNDVVMTLMQRLPPGGVLFDIGGGNGYVAAALEQAGLPTVVVEPGRAGAENACRRGLRNVICATVDAAQFAPGAMGAIGLFDVLEHVRDDGAFLVKLRPLLQPRGRIYLTVPAFQFLWSNEDRNVGHVRRYTTRSLAATLERAGFELEYATYFFSFLVFPVFLMRTLPHRIGWQRTISAVTKKREHAFGGGAMARLVGWARARECARLRAGRRMPFGASCLAVARRRGD
jgi:hypothetical protein